MEKGGFRIEINKEIDQKYYLEVQQGLKKNHGYCPCQINMSERTKCICLNFLENPEEVCHCGIYRKFAKKTTL